MFHHEVVSSRMCEIMVVSEQTHQCTYSRMWASSEHVFLYVYIFIMCLVSGTHVLVRLTLPVLWSYDLVHWCVGMVARAQPHGRVCSLYIFSWLCVNLMWVHLLVYRVCAVLCCARMFAKVTVSKYDVHLATPSETSIVNLLVVLRYG